VFRKEFPKRCIVVVLWVVTVEKVLINKVDRTYGKPLSKIYMIKKFILLINCVTVCAIM